MRAESVFCSWCYSKGLKLELAYGKQALNSCSINEWMVLLKRKPRLRKVKGFPPKAGKNETNPKHSDSILYTKPHHVPWWPQCWTHVSSLRLRDFCSIGQMAPEVPPVLRFCVALLGIYFDEGIMGALKKKKNRFGKPLNLSSSVILRSQPLLWMVTGCSLKRGLHQCVFWQRGTLIWVSKY